MGSYFDDTTAVTARGEGRFDAVLDDGWRVGGGLNGGYLLALLGTALRAALPGHPDPLALSASYVSASVAGPAEVDVVVKREGRSVAVASADLRQGPDVRIVALATYGDLDAEDADVQTTATPPDLPPREECVAHPLTDHPDAPPLVGRFEMLFHPGQVEWMHGEPAEPGTGDVLTAWFRLRDERGDRDPDPLILLLAVDALPPVTFTRGNLGWAPTLELTAHVRARPAPGWLRLTHRTRNLAGTMFEEDCEVWDDADRLVAQSRQLARRPR